MDVNFDLRDQLFPAGVNHPDRKFNSSVPKDASIPFAELLNDETAFRERFADPSLIWAIDVYQQPHPEYMRINNLAENTLTRGYHHGLLHREVEHLFYEVFGADKERRNLSVLFPPTGTAANRLLTTAVLDNRSSLITHSNAHLIDREGVSVEAQTGSRVHVLPTDSGRLNPEALEKFLEGFLNNSVITQMPKVFVLTNPTEEGLVYTCDEVREFSRVAHKYNLLFQIDGARLFHAAAFLNCSLRNLTTDAGVDMLALGGSKCGMYKAEASVFLPSFFEQFSKLHLYRDAESSWNIFRSILKRQGNLVGQSAGVAAQFMRALYDDFAITLARVGNEAARSLASQLCSLDGFYIFRPVESNAAYISLPKKIYPLVDLHYSQLMVLHETDPSRPDNTVVRFIASNTISLKEIEQTVKTISEFRGKYDDSFQ